MAWERTRNARPYILRAAGVQVPPSGRGVDCEARRGEHRVRGNYRKTASYAVLLPPLTRSPSRCGSVIARVLTMPRIVIHCARVATRPPGGRHPRGGRAAAASHRPTEIRLAWERAVADVGPYGDHWNFPTHIYGSPFGRAPASAGERADAHDRRGVTARSNAGPRRYFLALNKWGSQCATRRPPSQT